MSVLIESLLFSLGTVFFGSASFWITLELYTWVYRLAEWLECRPVDGPEGGDV